MTIKEKLLYFRDKIQMSIELNEELKNLISIELFDYIRHNADLKEEFFRRAGYFNDLVKDKKVVSIQENLFKKIVSVLQITDIQEIEKLQKQLDTEQKNTYKLINRLKYKGKMSDDEDYALTLIETYQALQDKSSYFKLGFKGGSTYSTEISYFQHTVQTIEQYRMAEALFNLISLNIIIDDEVLYKKFEQAIKEYNKFWFEFNELIYRTPIRLHTRAFENFILFCSTTTEIEGYEPYHKLHGLFENDKLSEIRKFVMAVIDDLIEFSETKAEAGAENKKLLINLDTFRFSEEFERTRKNTQAIAEELNKSFARDKEAFEITRAWFTAICRSTTPVMQQYQQTLENLAIQIEPFRQKLEEQAKVINKVSKTIIMPNFEAIAPILKDIESKAEEANKIYNEDKKSSLSTSIISPKIMESEQRNQIITELKGIRKKIEELNPSKNYTTPQKKEKTEVKENKGKIEKITIIKKDSGKFLLAINDNYGETKELKSSSKWWKIFIREIEERNMKPETRTNVEEITKDMSVYFNYNDEKCPIYMNGKYALTEIFVGQRADTIINPEIKTEIIPESKFLSRKNKKSKK